MTPAQEYRRLVDMLEALVEAPGDDSSADQGSFTPPTAPTAPANSGIPTIEAPNFKAAYAQAVKQKLKVFKWCGTYKVQAASNTNMYNKPQSSGQPSPAAEPTRRQFDPAVGMPGRSTGSLSANSGSDLPIAP